MSEQEIKELYEAANEKWGLAVQVGVAVEELNECSAALIRFLFRDKGSVDAVIDEVADARIMLEQVQQSMDIEERVNARRLVKLARLSEKVTKPEAS